jgi:hypothetical protein
MTQPTHSPVFTEGARVRDRVTGKTYTVGNFSVGGDWTTVLLPVPDDDGNRAMMLPTDDLAPAGDPDDVLRAAMTMTYWPGLSVPVAPLGVLVALVARVRAVAL